MQYYLIQKVRWLFNSFLTKMFNRRTNVALAGNVIGLGEVAEHKSRIEKQKLNLWKIVYLKTKTAILPNPC